MDVQYPSKLTPASERYKLTPEVSDTTEWLEPPLTLAAVKEFADRADAMRPPVEEDGIKAPAENNAVCSMLHA